MGHSSYCKDAEPHILVQQRSLFALQLCCSLLKQNAWSPLCAGIRRPGPSGRSGQRLLWAPSFCCGQMRSALAPATTWPPSSRRQGMQRTLSEACAWQPVLSSGCGFFGMH